jgi:hypothetical protein
MPQILKEQFTACVAVMVNTQSSAVVGNGELVKIVFGEAHDADTLGQNRVAVAMPLSSFISMVDTWSEFVKQVRPGRTQ